MSNVVPLLSDGGRWGWDCLALYLGHVERIQPTFAPEMIRSDSGSSIDKEHPRQSFLLLVMYI